MFMSSQKAVLFFSLLCEPYKQSFIVFFMISSLVDLNMHIVYKNLIEDIFSKIRPSLISYASEVYTTQGLSQSCERPFDLSLDMNTKDPLSLSPGLHKNENHLLFA